MTLHVHCDKKQSVPFAPEENLIAVVNGETRTRTPLTEFFQMNNDNPDGEKLLYADFPQFYTWDDRLRIWKIRKKGTMIGRLTFVNLADDERYFLQMLLINVKGPKSYEHLKTVDGHVCNSYQEACIRLGLIDEDNTAEMCLQEAAMIKMPQALRRLFVTLLIFCRPANPSQLWDKYYEHMSQEFRHSNPHNESLVLMQTAANVEQLLEHMGKDFAEFDLHHLQDLQTEEMRLTRDIRDAIETDIPKEYILARKQLNAEQRTTYKAIMQHVKSNIPGVFFIDGPGGTGKTYLYGALIGKLRSMSKIVLPTAFSGIAASCLPCGRTAYSRFKLPIDHDISLSCNVPKQGSLAKLIQQATIIIWDEAPMANKASIHALDMLLQDLCDCPTVFGGKIIIFGGDFRQVLPVVPQKTQKEAVEASLVCSHLWPAFRRFYLTQNMRAREDLEFAQFLLALGDGRLQSTEVASINLPPCISVLKIDETEAVDALLHLYTSTDQTPEAYTNRAILTPRNDEVD